MSVTLFFDGCCKGNPGPGGAGAVLYEDTSGHEIAALSVFVGPQVTNNVAEYKGLCIGLEEVDRLGYLQVHVKGDSLLVIKQMRGEYKVSSDHLREWHQTAKALERNIVRKKGSVTYEHVYRKDNKRADALSNEPLHGSKE